MWNALIWASFTERLKEQARFVDNIAVGINEGVQNLDREMDTWTYTIEKIVWAFVVLEKEHNTIYFVY